MFCRNCGYELDDAAKFCVQCGHPVLYDAPPRPRVSDVQHAEEARLYTLSPLPNAPVSVPPLADTRRRSPWTTVGLSVACLVGAFVCEVVGVIVCALLGTTVDVMQIVALAAATLGSAAGVVLMGGAELLRPDARKILESLKAGWWVLACAGGLCVYEIWSTMADGEIQMVEEWPLTTLYLLVLCTFIGFNEELMFRGLLLGGLLDVGGKNRRGLFLACAVAALLFGMAHIDWGGLAYEEPVQMLQAVLKVVQTGTYGFFLAALVTKTRNIHGAALLHAIDDFLLLFPSAGLMGEKVETNYVMSGDDAMVLVAFYAFVVVLYLPLVVKGIRMLRNMELPEHGTFHKGERA